MFRNRRQVWGAISITLISGTALTLLLHPAMNHSVTAQDTSAISAAQLNVAMSLEGAFMRVAETVGPATVSIAATETIPERAKPTPSPNAPKNAPDTENSDPFDDLFGPDNNPRRRAPRTTTATGSGVIVRPDGYILTNDHITETSRNGEVTVTLADGTVYKGKVMRDYASDLAVVKVNPEKPLPFVKMADSSKVHVGQWAVAIGSPFGQQNTVTTGIISALHRKRTIGDSGDLRLYPNLIQTDASINPGNSGGPLLNIQGEMIGINVAIYSPTGTSLGIGYAIPANTAKSVVEQLISKGRVVRGSLGVVPDDVPAGLRRRLGATQGAYVLEVAPDSPADKAGVQVEDVITRFNTMAIANESDLREAIALTAPGTKVTLSFIRGGKPEMLTAVLEERKENPALNNPGNTKPTSQASTELGFEAVPLTNEAVVARKLPVGTRGLLVRLVTPGGLASQENLIAGDVILAVNGVSVTTPDALNKFVSQAKSGETLTLIVLRVRRNEKPSRAAINITLP